MDICCIITLIVEADAACVCLDFCLGGERIAREFAKAFYNSPEWEKTRQYVLARDKYKCVKCGRPAEEVHHKKHLTPDNIHDPWIALNPDNLASLCKDCHFAEHREDKAAGKKAHEYKTKSDCRDGYHFDEFGQVVPD